MIQYTGRSRPYKEFDHNFKKNLTGLRKLHTSGTTAKPVRFIGKGGFYDARAA
jgi:hypothetical protein